LRAYTFVGGQGGAIFFTTGVGIFYIYVVDFWMFLASCVYYFRIVFYISFMVFRGVCYFGGIFLVLFYCVRFFIASRASINSIYLIRMASCVSTVSVLCGIIAFVIVYTSLPFVVGIYLGAGTVTIGPLDVGRSVSSVIWWSSQVCIFGSVRSIRFNVGTGVAYCMFCP